jgi:hypothetical protein
VAGESGYGGWPKEALDDEAASLNDELEDLRGLKDFSDPDAASKRIQEIQARLKAVQDELDAQAKGDATGEDVDDPDPDVANDDKSAPPGKDPEVIQPTIDLVPDVSGPNVSGTETYEDAIGTGISTPSTSAQPAQGSIDDARDDADEDWDSDDEGDDADGASSSPEQQPSWFATMVNALTFGTLFRIRRLLFGDDEDDDDEGRGCSPLAIGILTILVVVTGIAVAAVLFGGGGGNDGSGGGSNGHETAGSPVYLPTFIDPTRLVMGSGSPWVPVLTKATTNASEVNPQDAALYQGLDFSQNGFLANRNVDPGDESSWPDGVEGSINYEVDTFQTNKDAVAVERAWEAGLGKQNFAPVEVSRAVAGQGIAAFEPARVPSTGLINRIFYWTRGNVLFAIADTGKFPKGSRRPAQDDLFNALNGSLREGPLSKGAPFTKDQAGSAYADAIAPVNDTAPTFRAQAESWDATTTGTQAQADARPLAAALDSVESEVLRILGRYAPARPELRKVIAALEVVNADLSDLPRLNTIGVMAWRSRYDAAIAAVTEASNTVRGALGLPITRS